MEGNPSSPHEHKLLVQHLPMSWSGKGSAVARLTAGESAPASKAPAWCRWPSAQQCGLRESGVGEERDAEICGMRSPPELGVVKERGAPAASTLRAE